MRSTQEYFSSFFNGLGSLLKGMSITLREFFTPKTTEKYRRTGHPENVRPISGVKLTMPHNERNEHHCVACGICEMNCPNDTIRVESEMVTTEDGKKKKVLVRYLYDHGSCLYCQLCVRSCPHQAITFIPTYEHAVFTREKLVLQLNHEGSRLETKNEA